MTRLDSSRRPSSKACECRLAWLLDPITPSEFSRKFHEQRLCLVRRNDEDHYAGLIGLRDLDVVLGAHDVHHGGVRLARGEEELLKETYTRGSGRIDPLLVAKQFDQGATVIFNQLHRRVSRLGEFCASLGEIFGSRVQANVYLTPPHGQGFRPHWDTHDVFVLQISGEKRWSIYDTKVTLPLQGQRFDPKQDVPGSVKEEFRLRPGSVVYIPRGVMHSARSGTEASLHVTVGITAYTWTDWFLESVAAVALQDRSLRESLPFRFVYGDFPSEERERLIKEKAEGLAARLIRAEVWKQFRNTVRVENSPLVTDLLSSRVSGDALKGTSRVRRRRGVVVEVETHTDGCGLCFLGQELNFAARRRPALSFLAAADVFTVEDIPDCLESEEKVALVNRLIADGLLEVSR